MQPGNAGRRWALKAALVLVASAVAAAVVVAGLYLRAPRATRVRVGDRAPDLELPAVVDGTPARFTAAGPGPTVLLFFDTRGPNAERYLRYVEERINRRYFQRGLRVVGICTDTDLAAARALASSVPLTFALLSDPEARVASATFGAPRAPEAYLLDRTGRVEAVFTEQIDVSDPEVRAALERGLGPAPGGF